MKITLCGSIAFAKDILEIEEKLIQLGHTVIVPQSILDFSVKNDQEASHIRSDRKKYIAEIKPYYTRNHFNKIEESDAILVVNCDKNGIKNYIGGATFAEIMLAYHKNKKIFFLNPIPTHENLSILRDELETVQPIILNGDAANITDHVH